MDGDVIRLVKDEKRCYANHFLSWADLAGSGQKREIPVDNVKFSTLSTAFSTGLFHRDPALWKTKGN